MLLIIQYFHSLRLGKKFLFTNSWACCHLVYRELENLIYKYGEFRRKSILSYVDFFRGQFFMIWCHYMLCDSFFFFPLDQLFKNVCGAQKRQYISLLSKGEIFFFLDQDNKNNIFLQKRLCTFSSSLCVRWGFPKFGIPALRQESLLGKHSLCCHQSCPWVLEDKGNWCEHAVQFVWSNSVLSLSLRSLLYSTSIYETTARAGTSVFHFLQTSLFKPLLGLENNT